MLSVFATFLSAFCGLLLGCMEPRACFQKICKPELQISYAQYTNKQITGARIVAKSHILDISACSFVQCKVSDLKDGGAIQCTDSSINLKLSRVGFTKCQSPLNGGAIYGTFRHIAMNNTFFEYCRALHIGMAAVLSSSTPSCIERTSVILCGHTKDEASALMAITCEKTSMILLNSSINEPHSKFGGIYFMRPSEIYVRFADFVRNKGPGLIKASSPNFKFALEDANIVGNVEPSLSIVGASANLTSVIFSRNKFTSIMSIGESDSLLLQNCEADFFSSAIGSGPQIKTVGCVFDQRHPHLVTLTLLLRSDCFESEKPRANFETVPVIFFDVYTQSTIKQVEKSATAKFTASRQLQPKLGILQEFLPFILTGAALSVFILLSARKDTKRPQAQPSLTGGVEFKVVDN